MMYKIHSLSKWRKKALFWGCFNSLDQALSYLQYLQSKLPNGKKIVFQITE